MMCKLESQFLAQKLGIINKKYGFFRMNMTFRDKGIKSIFKMKVRASCNEMP